MCRRAPCPRRLPISRFYVNQPSAQVKEISKKSGLLDEDTLPIPGVRLSCQTKKFLTMVPDMVSSASSFGPEPSAPLLPFANRGAPVEKYSLQLIWSANENAYVATVPEIPQVTQIAATAAEALAKLHDAIGDYLREKKAKREATPPPRRLEEYSGQFRLRLPRVLHASLVREAEAEGISLNSYLLYLLSHRYAQHEAIQQAAASYGEEIRETIQCMHEMVASVTVSTPAQPPFLLHNDSSITITEIQ